MMAVWPSSASCRNSSAPSAWMEASLLKSFADGSMVRPYFLAVLAKAFPIFCVMSATRLITPLSALFAAPMCVES